MTHAATGLGLAQSQTATAQSEMLHVYIFNTEDVWDVIVISGALADSKMSWQQADDTSADNKIHWWDDDRLHSKVIDLIFLIKHILEAMHCQF